MKTSVTHPLHIDEVQTCAGGRIGLTLCPGKQQRISASGPWLRSLPTDVEAIALWGAQAVVSLVTKDELAELKVEGLGAAVRAKGILWFHLPIEDVDAPGPVWDEAWSLVTPLLWRILATGGRVLLHCKAGLGRAGMVAAMLLVEDGDTPTEAIRRIRTVRDGAIQTKPQERYVRAHVTPRVSPIADTSHFEFFLKCQFERQGEFGRVPANWARQVLRESVPSETATVLDQTPIARARLHAIRNQGHCSAVLFLSIMAWGGMKVSHGRLAWEQRKHWSVLIGQATEGGRTRQALFAAFDEVPIPGMRAAYFTKLIHFCQRRDGLPIGYIMDQWTAKSINQSRPGESGQRDKWSFCLTAARMP